MVNVTQMIDEVVCLRKEVKRVQQLLSDSEQRLGWACDQGISFLASDVVAHGDEIDLPFI